VVVLVVDGSVQSSKNRVAVYRAEKVRWAWMPQRSVTGS
jgi:hypothetical protein